MIILRTYFVAYNVCVCVYVCKTKFKLCLNNKEIIDTFN